MLFKKIITVSSTLFIVCSCLYMIRDNMPKGSYFPHETHVGEASKVKDADCFVCHDGIDKATDMSVRFVPTNKTVCFTACHHEESDLEAPPHGVTLRTRPSVIDFNHNLHLGFHVCMDCHEKVVTDDYIKIRSAIPTHEKCIECHDDWVPTNKFENNIFKGTCKNCHKKDIKPRNHYENWMEMHRTEAAGAYSTECAPCHADKNNCTTCHAGGVFRPQSHDLTWVRTHGMLVRNDIQNCTSCHTTDNCQDCHRRRGISGSIPYRQTYDIGKHPPGWVSDVPNTGNHHSVTARMNLESCKACHMASDCTSCHFKRFPYGR